MKFIFTFLLPLVFVSLLVSQSVNAVAVMENRDDVEINWGKMQFRFSGESKLAEGEDTYKEAEARAWQTGLYKIMDVVKTLYNEKSSSIKEDFSAEAQEAAHLVSTSTYSYNTTYFADGTVRVHLENRLPRAFGLNNVKFKHNSQVPTTGIQFTGIVLKSDKAIEPKGSFQIIDEKGQVLFDVTDMAEDAYRRGLMGRWFTRATKSELALSAGKNPIEVNVTARSNGNFVVSSEQWENALSNYKPLLVNGNIAINLP